jgi:hypothetical protein
MVFFKLGISVDVGTQVAGQPVITCRYHVCLNTIRYVVPDNMQKPYVYNM